MVKDEGGTTGEWNLVGKKKKKEKKTFMCFRCTLGLTTVHLNWMSIASSGSEIYLHESFNSHPWHVHILDVLPA